MPWGGRCRPGAALRRRSASASPGSRAWRSSLRAARSAPTAPRRSCSRSISAAMMPWARYMPAHRSEIGMPTRQGPPPGGPVTLMSAAEALRDLVDARALGVGAVLPEAGDAAVDDARVDRAQRLVVDLEAVLDVGAEVLDDDVGVLHQAVEDVAAGVGLQVERRSSACCGAGSRGRSWAGCCRCRRRRAGRPGSPARRGRPGPARRSARPARCKGPEL